MTAQKMTSPARLLALVALVGALLASMTGTADAQVERTRARPVEQVEPLRLACAPDSIDGERGVVCRWSEASNPGLRAYQLYRITDGSPRELVTTVTADGRLGYFDTDVQAPSQLTYGVIGVNTNGRLIARSAAVRVQFGQPVEQLRLACAPDSVDGQRGVLCRWSAVQQADARGYQLYRIVDGGPREVIAAVPAGGRTGHLDTNFVPGATHVYGVTGVDRAGHVIAVGGPERVQWPDAG